MPPKTTAMARAVDSPLATMARLARLRRTFRAGSTDPESNNVTDAPRLYAKSQDNKRFGVGRPSVTSEGCHHLCCQGRSPGDLLFGVGDGHGHQAEVGADEPQWFRLPAGGAVPDPRQCGQLGVGTRDQVGQRAPGDVGGAEAIPDIASGLRHTGFTVE